jgi:alkylhydroperoxidase family enzyme
VVGKDVADAVLADYRSAPIGEPLRATLALLEVAARAPDDLSPELVEVARRAGVSDEAIGDALYICALFGIINRLADAFGFAIPSERGFADHPLILLHLGYAM